MDDSKDSEQALPSPEQALETYQANRPAENLSQASATLMQLLPGVGTLLGTYLNDGVNNLYRQRLDTLLESIVKDFSHTQRKMNLEFVKSADLVDLFGEVVPRVQKERDEDKRRYYKNILLGAVTGESVDPYDQAMKYVRTLEELQPVHVVVLRAVAIELPEEELWKRDLSGGFMINTLLERLPQVSREQFPEVLDDLNRARVTNFRVDSLSLAMSGASAANLRSRLTEYGKAFVAFVLEA